MVLHSPSKPSNPTSSSLKRSYSDFDGSEFDHNDPKKHRSNDRELLELILQKISRLDIIEENQLKSDKKLEKLDLLESISATVKVHENQIKFLSDEMTKLQNENERLNIELGKLNLIYHGIPDSKDESSTLLFEKLDPIIGGNNIDTAWRLGKFSDNMCRPVKVRFISLYARENAFQNRKKFKPPTYVNPDLPKSTRMLHSSLRKMKSDAIANGQRAEILWNQNIIRIDGIAVSPKNKSEVTPMNTVSKKSSSSKNISNQMPLPDAYHFLGVTPTKHRMK